MDQHFNSPFKNIDLEDNTGIGFRMQYPPGAAKDRARKLTDP
ncbi:hypothetical protein BGLA2_260070 [Burkholderia gladioli]|nr:hypothetical protein BGLA2_260070 [Burkholderia gladioli]